MIRKLSALGAPVFAFLVFAALVVSAPAQAADAAGRSERAASEVVLAALPSARVQGAEPAVTPEQRPAKRERRCTFGIFPAASSRCIA